jgi:transposase InsO family protein
MNVAFEKDMPCGACQAGKQVGATYRAKNTTTTTRPLKMLHIDLFGPITYINIGGNKYGLVIIDDYSRFTWVFFLQDKDEISKVLKKFLKRTQNEFDAKVKRIRSDNGTEFKNTQVEDYLDEEGIKHEFDREPLSQFFSLAQLFSSLALNSFSKLSYAIVCRCLSRELQAVMHLVATPPPTTAQAEEMILWLLLTQGGQQENPLGEVMQVPPKLKRKLQMWPRARL